MNFTQVAARKPAHAQDDDRVAESADLYEIGENTRPIRTTKELAIAAYNIDLAKARYEGKDWLLALALGTAMLQMLEAGMADHHETEAPLGLPSILAVQLLQGYKQLRDGKGDVERKFREAFFAEYKHFPRDVCDIRGGATRLKDAEMLVRVVRNFCPWQEVADDFERCVFAEDTAVFQKFLFYYFWVLTPELSGRVLAPGRDKDDDETNRSWLTIEQDGTVVKITFGPRWRPNPKYIAFVGELGDKTGATFRIVDSTLTADKAAALIASFNERRDDDAMTLDARVRALGEQGFVVTAHPKTGRAMLVDVRGLKSVFG